VTNSLVRNIVRTFSTQVGCQIVTIAAGIAIARMIGPAGKGFVSYAATAASLVAVFFYGFTDAVFYQFGKQNYPARAVYNAIMRVTMVALAVIVPVFVVLAVLVPTQRPLAAAAAAVPFLLYMQLATPFLLVRDNILLTNIRALTQSLGAALVVLPLLFFAHLGLGAAIGVWILFCAVSALQSYWGMRPILASSPPAHEAPKELATEQLIYGTRAAGVAIAGFLNLRVDVFVVSVMLSGTALGWYTLAIASGEMLWQVTRALVWPALGRIGSDSMPDAARLVARLTRNILAIVGSLGIVAFVIGPWLIVHVYGEAFAPAGVALRWALPGLVAYAAEVALTKFILLQLGRPFTLIWIQSGGAILCAAITIATAGRFGIVAAAAATSLTYLVVTIILTRVFTRATKITTLQLLLIQHEDLIHYTGAVNATLRTLRLRSA
jgi:O-antigen/teichoic acid export membrane protein